MDEQDWLAERFEASRGRLRSVAYRMLGSLPEADDAVQEAWLRLARAGAGGVDNLEGWLTTVVARVCLDMLRSRRSRREERLGGDDEVGWPAQGLGAQGPEEEALFAEAVGPALLAVLQTLQPAERLAFVLHDSFGVPFEEVGAILGRSPAAARQLASRARRRVQGKPHGAAVDGPDFARQHEVVSAFLAAARSGDFAALVELLDPGVIFRADQAAVRAAAARRDFGAPPLEEELHGVDAVARVFLGHAEEALPALVGGGVGAAWVFHGRPASAFVFGWSDGKIASIEVVMGAERLRDLGVSLLSEPGLS